MKKDPAYRTGSFSSYDINILQSYFSQIRPKISPLILTETSQWKAYQSPEMYCIIAAFKMIIKVVYLWVAVMAWSYTIGCPRRLNLAEFQSAIIMSGFGKSWLQISTSSTTTVVIGHVRGHINKIFLTDNGLYNKPEILGYGITKGLSHKLTGILYCELYLQVPVPVWIYLEFSLFYPLSV